MGFVVSLSAEPGYQSLTVPAEDLLSVPDPRNNAGTVVEGINNAGVVSGGWNEDTGNVDGCGNPIFISHGFIARPSETTKVIEYHNSDFDHYFITPVAAEIALLDAHAPPFQAWSRTGFSFNAYVNATAPAGAVSICRFFNDRFAPKSSHFYAAHGLACEATKTFFPDWLLEDDNLFNTMLPYGSGACPAGTIPVYRLYNSGMGGAPNHRFVTSLGERQNMLNKGYTPEGNGIGVGTISDAARRCALSPTNK